MMYYDVLTIYRSNIQRKSSRTPLPVAVDLHLLEQLDTPILGCATHHSRGWMQTCESSLEKHLVRKASLWELVHFVGGKCVFST